MTAPKLCPNIATLSVETAAHRFGNRVVLRIKKRIQKENHAAPRTTRNSSASPELVPSLIESHRVSPT